MKYQIIPFKEWPLNIEYKSKQQLDQHAKEVSKELAII